MLRRLFIYWIEFSLYFLQGLFCPLLRLLIPPFSKRARERLAFELLNESDASSRSFALDSIKADVCFEVSSEGEAEQVLPVIEDFLSREQFVEIIYFSESAEKKIQNFVLKYPKHIRVLRFPLMTYSFYSLFGGQSISMWMTARKLFLCRYDFFPELFVLGSRDDFSFILLNASLKSKEKSLEKKSFFSLSSLKRYYWLSLYDLFDFIIASSKDDEERFLRLGIEKEKLEFFDFRIVQILKRLEKSSQRLMSLEGLQKLLAYLERYPYEKRLLLGSAYPCEMALFENTQFLDKIINGEIFVCMAPHKLDEKDLAILSCSFESKTAISSKKVSLYHYHKGIKENEIEILLKEMMQNPGVLLFSVPAVLCELYTLFGSSFVGGGHSKGIHSVLEPYVAGSSIYVGPKVFRSTEFDIVSFFSPKYIHRLEKLEDFHPLFFRNLNHDFKEERKRRGELLSKQNDRFQGILTHVR